MLRFQVDLLQPPELASTNASELRSLGTVRIEQAELLSGPARLTKLNVAQTNLEASLIIEPNNALVLNYLDNIKEARNRQIESGKTAS